MGIPSLASWSHQDSSGGAAGLGPSSEGRDAARLQQGPGKQLGHTEHLYGSRRRTQPRPLLHPPPGGIEELGLPRSPPPASLNKGSSLPSVPLKWTRATFLALWFLVPWSLRLLLLVLSFTFSCLLVLFLRGIVLFLDRMHSCIPHNTHRHIVGLSSYLFNKCLCRES